MRESAHVTDRGSGPLPNRQLLKQFAVLGIDVLVKAPQTSKDAIEQA